MDNVQYILMTEKKIIILWSRGNEMWKEWKEEKVKLSL
jgi:hypothetical protein